MTRMNLSTVMLIGGKKLSQKNRCNVLPIIWYEISCGKKLSRNTAMCGKNMESKIKVCGYLS